MWVRDYSIKKVVQYFTSAKKVCIIFRHPLADVVSFMPIYERMRRDYPNVEFSISLNPELNALFGGIETIDEEIFDHVFVISYFGDLYSRHPKSKNLICCENEIGIKYDADFAYGGFSEGFRSPLIAVDFVSTIDDAVMGCPREKAAEICDRIRKFGLIPVDVHFDSMENLAEYYSYSFVSASFAKDINGKPEKLISSLKGCSGYVGVIGDSFMVAKQMFENDCLAISNGIGVGIYLLPDTRNAEANVNEPDFIEKIDGFLNDFLTLENVSKTDEMRNFVRNFSGSDKIDWEKTKVTISENGVESEVEIRPFGRSAFKRKGAIYI